MGATPCRGAKTEIWQPQWRKFSGGESPTKWRITLNFSSLVDIEGRAVPAGAVRKMRWTYPADLQAGAFERSEFEVKVTNWSVTGSGRTIGGLPGASESKTMPRRPATPEHGAAAREISPAARYTTPPRRRHR
jgi:hypothetical protein